MTGAGLMAASISVFQEQCFAVLLGVELISISSHWVEKPVFYLHYLLIRTLTLGGAGLLAPGNRVRFAQEILTWYPGFASVSLPVRLLDVVHILFVTLFQKNIFFLILLVAVLVGRWLKNRRSIYLVVVFSLASLAPVYF